MRKTFLIILSLAVWCMAGQAAVTLEEEKEQRDMVTEAMLKRTRGDYKGAIKLLNKAEKIDPLDDKVYFQRMYIYDKLGKTKKAIDELMEHVSLTEYVGKCMLIDVLKKDLDYSLKKAMIYSTNTYHSTIFRELIIIIYILKNDYNNAIVEFQNMEKDFGPVDELNYNFIKCDIYTKLRECGKIISEMSKCIE